VGEGTRYQAPPPGGDRRPLKLFIGCKMLRRATMAGHLPPPVDTCSSRGNRHLAPEVTILRRYTNISLFKKIIVIIFLTLGRYIPEKV